MAKWACYGVIAATKYLGTVEAATEDEAKERAYGLDECRVAVCHHCSRDVSDPEITDVIVEAEEK